MQISRIIEFMQREQCENENEEITFILCMEHKTFVIDIRWGNNITGKSFDSHSYSVEALAECNLDLIKDIASFTVH